MESPFPHIPPPIWDTLHQSKQASQESHPHFPQYWPGQRWPNSWRKAPLPSLRGCLLPSPSLHCPVYWVSQQLKLNEEVGPQSYSNSGDSYVTAQKGQAHSASFTLGSCIFLRLLFLGLAAQLLSVISLLGGKVLFFCIDFHCDLSLFFPLSSTDLTINVWPINCKNQGI